MARVYLVRLMNADIVSKNMWCPIFAITYHLLIDFENSFTVGNSNQLSTK